jgi:hypothetical protein
MSPRNLIGVLIRMTAVLICLYGLYLLIAGIYDVMIIMFFGSARQLSLINFTLRTLLPAGAYVAGALFIIRHAERVVQFAYPHRRGYCDQCGYDLRASPERCPECGAVPIPKADR